MSAHRCPPCDHQLPHSQLSTLFVAFFFLPALLIGVFNDWDAPSDDDQSVPGHDSPGWDREDLLYVGLPSVLLFVAMQLIAFFGRVPVGVVSQEGGEAACHGWHITHRLFRLTRTC